MLPEVTRAILRIGLFLLLYFDSRAWFTKNNFVEVAGAQEAFLIFLVIFFLGIVLPKSLLTLKVDIDGFFVLSVIAFVLLVSSVGAYLTFGQPIYAGIIEERRVLSYLIFFPVALAIRSNLASARTVLNYVTASALLCVLNAGIYYMTVSSLEAVQSFTSEAQARADRTPIGTGFVLIGLCYVLSRYVERPRFMWAFLYFVFVFDVVVLEQGRQTIIAVAVASALLLAQSKEAIKRLAITCLLSFLAIVPFIWNSVVKTWQKYVFLFQLLSEAHNLRVETLHVVFSKNLIVPHGSLWAQWDEGFARYFGPNFFLSDIGVFGELFRYGAVLLAILLTCYYGYIYLSIRSARWTVVTRTCAAAIFILAILHVFQPVIEHGGFDVGLLIALLASERRVEKHMLLPEASLAS